MVGQVQKKMDAEGQTNRPCAHLFKNKRMINNNSNWSGKFERIFSLFIESRYVSVAYRSKMCFIANLFVAVLFLSFLRGNVLAVKCYQCTLPKQTGEKQGRIQDYPSRMRVGRGRI